MHLSYLSRRMQLPASDGVDHNARKTNTRRNLKTAILLKADSHRAMDRWSNTFLTVLAVLNTLPNNSWRLLI